MKNKADVYHQLIQKRNLEDDELRLLAIQRTKELELHIKSIQDSLKNAPEGYLRIQLKGERVQYYQRKDPHNTIGTYIKKSEYSLAKALAQKTFDMKLLRELLEEMDALETLLKNYHPNRQDTIYCEQPTPRKQLIRPYRVPDHLYVEQWQAVEYTGLPISQAQEFITDRGETVRSKSELMIANSLNKHGIPYRYEYPIRFRDGTVLHPDFLCLHIQQRREVIWEHFGMMGNETYCNNVLMKLRGYAANDYVTGKDLIMTFETTTCPLSTSMIEHNIKHFLVH